MAARFIRAAQNRYLYIYPRCQWRGWRSVSHPVIRWHSRYTRGLNISGKPPSSFASSSNLQPSQIGSFRRPSRPYPDTGTAYPTRCRKPADRSWHEYQDSLIGRLSADLLIPTITHFVTLIIKLVNSELLFRG